MKKQPIIHLNNVSKIYFEQSQQIASLRNISLKVYPGEKVGVIGANGAGKTTLLRLISGITRQTSGTIKVSGKIASIIELTAGFHPDLTGIENIYLCGLLLGMRRTDINQRLPEIIKFSELEEVSLSHPTHTYSSGMLLRLGFSIAINADPDIFVLDENIVVGDQDFQKKAYDAVEDMFHREKTVIIGTHFLPLVKRLCNRIVWIEKGEIKMIGGDEVIREYRNNRKDIFRDSLPEQPYAETIFEMTKSLAYGADIQSRALSSSMEPCILKGESFIIRRVRFSDVKPGDQVAFWNAEFKSIMVHRCIKRTVSKLMTKGDNNLIADDFVVSKNDFLGVVLT